MVNLKDKAIFDMSGDHQPIETVRSGDVLVFKTRDCFDNQIQEESQGIDCLDWNHINPATGPVFIETAQPGDVLKITILDILVEEWGTMAAIVDNGVLGKLVTESSVKRIQVLDGIAHFNERIKIPVRPMIGVIGVAPASNGIPCGEPGAHGGNMDNTKIQKGAVLYLPVFRPGALLALGDVHACMGDGEIMVSGLEIAAKVTVQAEVIKKSDKNHGISNPMLEDETNLYTIASHEDLEQAIYMAADDMNRFLQKRLHMDLNEAGMLMSAAGSLEFCQVVDPKRTVRFCMSKSLVGIETIME